MFTDRVFLKEANKETRYDSAIGRGRKQRIAIKKTMQGESSVEQSIHRICVHKYILHHADCDICYYLWNVVIRHRLPKWLSFVSFLGFDRL